MTYQLGHAVSGDRQWSRSLSCKRSSRAIATESAAAGWGDSAGAGADERQQVMGKLISTATGAAQSLLSKALAQTTNTGLANILYMNILSRYPTAAETQTAATMSEHGNRTQKAQELMWTLYNKVDFMFNY